MTTKSGNLPLQEKKRIEELKHFTPGDRGYVPRTTDQPVNIRIARRG